MRTLTRSAATLVVLSWAMSAMSVSAQDDATPGAERRRLSQPVVLAEGLEVLHYWVAPRLQGMDAGSVQVYGELLNTTDVELDAPPVGFRLYDAEGDVLGGVVALPLYHVIPPGKAMPFQGDEYDERLPLDEVGNVEVVLCDQWGLTYYVDQGYGFANVEIEDHEVLRATDSGIEIDGTVRNNGEVPAYIRVQVAVYDEEGRYVGAYQDFTDAPVPPGKTGRFTIDQVPGLQSPPGPLDRVRGQDYTFDLWAGIDDQTWFYSC